LTDLDNLYWNIRIHFFKGYYVKERKE